MKVQKHAIGLACLAALGMGSAQAVQVAGELLDVYGVFYPQYQVTSFADGSTATPSQMVGSNTPAAPASGATKVPVDQINWVNSYIGFKGQKAFGDVRAGFDLQGIVMKNGTLTTETAEIGEARDAFVFLSHSSLGTVQMGQMDTIFKEFGDRVRMLGVSSSNFISTAAVTLAPSWKTQTATTSALYTTTGKPDGISTFNTRVNGQLRWLSPNWNGFEAGFSYRPDPAKSAAQDQSLQAAGIRWSNATYYLGWATETHNDYRAVTGGSIAAPLGTTIYNTQTTRSRDTASRVSFGYTNPTIRVGADVVSLSYNEDAAAASTGKFQNYQTTAWQVTGEVIVNPNLTLAAGYAVGAAGSCTLSGAGPTSACSTDGLGGSQYNLGGRYDYDKNIGIFLIYAMNRNNGSAVFNSSNIGGNVTNAAMGLNVKF